MDLVSTSKLFYGEGVLGNVVSFVSDNIFRALPPAPVRLGFDPEEEDSQPDEAWPHLQLVYDFFVRFLVSSEQNPKVCLCF